jgi:hypothetical protein
MGLTPVGLTSSARRTARWTVAAAGAAAPSLVGHLIFGGVLGATYHRLQSRAGEAAPAHVTSPA